MIELKGMTWSHERGIRPLEAASRSFSQKRKDVRISWDARSLKDFELFPLEELAGNYDFLMIDHPHIGSACAQNLLLDLGELLDPVFLDDQKSNAVGKSFTSYFWEGSQWALPVDAAAQVCAYREDLLGDERIPVSWEDVFSLPCRLKPGRLMAIPFVPVHAYSSFFTLCSQIGGREFWSEGLPVLRETGRTVLDILARILSASHPVSFDSDPIGILDLIGAEDTIAYVPLIYGYSNYARRGFMKNIVRFGNIPSDTGRPEGSMIGGVGLAVSSRCSHRDMAAEFVTMVGSPSYQKGEFFETGGQPGHRSAWTDPVVNKVSSGFFSETLATLDAGSMRPRFDGYISFQEQAGIKIREYIKEKRSDSASFIDGLNKLFFDIRNQS